MHVMMAAVVVWPVPVVTIKVTIKIRTKRLRFKGALTTVGIRIHTKLKIIRPDICTRNLEPGEFLPRLSQQHKLWRGKYLQ